MDSVISNNEGETRHLGARWARTLEPGWLIGLVGDLGTGKTQLVKGFARGLGVEEPILSPSFALVYEYRGGRCPLYHLDLYRLKNHHDALAAGLDTYLAETSGFVFVEWFDRLTEDPNHQEWRGPRGRRARLRVVRFQEIENEVRKICYADFGD